MTLSYISIYDHIYKYIYRYIYTHTHTQLIFIFLGFIPKTIDRFMQLFKVDVNVISFALPSRSSDELIFHICERRLAQIGSRETTGATRVQRSKKKLKKAINCLTQTKQS